MSAGVCVMSASVYVMVVRTLCLQVCNVMVVMTLYLQVCM